jgi:hypothetical protein
MLKVQLAFQGFSLAKQTIMSSGLIVPEDAYVWDHAIQNSVTLVV